MLRNTRGHQGLSLHHLSAVPLQVAVDVPAYQCIGRDKADGAHAQRQRHGEKDYDRTNDGKDAESQA